MPTWQSSTPAQSRNDPTSRFAGQVLPGITISREENLGTSLVLTGNYIHARVPGLSVPPNRLVNIHIEEVRPEATYASILEY
jgi:hypothetical protein